MCRELVEPVRRPDLMKQQPNPSKAVGYQTRSLTRALSILDAFATEKRALSVKDLHELLALPKPTVSRLARELEKGGYLRDSGRAYELGPKTFELGSQFARQYRFHDVGEPLLRTLAKDLEQTSCLALLAGHQIVHAIVVPSPRPIQYVTEVGSSADAHSTALGKALLSLVPEESVEELLGEGELARFTRNTIVERSQLLTELRAVRQRGYAIDVEETAVGLMCVGVAAKLRAAGAVAISVSGPAADFNDETIPVFADAVRSTMRQLEAALGMVANYPMRLPRSDLAST
jgi:IclR family acetate operon transcriptional repressor